MSADAGEQSPVAGPIDGGPTDAGPIDAGPTDAGPTDAGPTDAGPTDAGPTDAQALAALRSGTPAEVAGVVRAWSPAMIRLARAQLADAASAEDVVQDAWLTVLTGLPRFEGRSALRTWVFGIVVNHARRAGDRQRRTVPLSGQWWQERAELRAPAVPAARFDADGGWRAPPLRGPLLPEDEVGVTELRQVLDRALGALPVRQRCVLVASDGLELPAADVAALFGMTAANQRVLLHRARNRLRAAVEDYAAERSGLRPPNGSPDAAAQPVRRSVLRRARDTSSLACRELVELVNDYLDGNLDTRRRRAVEEHLAHCDHCPHYVAQVQRLIELTSVLTVDAPADVVERLVAAVRPVGPGRLP